MNPLPPLERCVNPRPTASPARAPQAPVFDPVIGVARGVVPAGDLLADAQIAYELTKDRRYLRVIRQLRRLR